MRPWTARPLAAVCALLLAIPALAGEVSESVTNRNVAGPGLYYWGGSHWERWTGDANGPGVRVVNGPETFLYNYPSIINQQLIAGNRDSSAAYPVAGANHIYLYFTFLDSSATRETNWAILISRHQNSSTDSLSMWPDVPMGTNGVVTSGIAGFRHNVAADTIGTAGNDSTAVLNTSQPWAREYLISVPNGMAAPRRQFSVELCDRTGRPLTAVYLSVRIRMLNAIGATSSTPIAARSIVRIDMQGTR